MSALSALANIMPQKPSAPTAPDPSKIAIPQIGAVAPAAAIARVNGGQISAPSGTPPAPVGGQTPRPVSGSIADVVRQTNNATEVANNNNPSLQQDQAAAGVKYWNTQKDNATAAKQKADSDVTTLTPQYTQAQQNVASLKTGVDGDYENATTDYNSPHPYNPTTDGAPQLLLNIKLNGDGANSQWVGTVYTLQPDGTYQPQQVSLNSNQLAQLKQGKTAVFAQDQKAINAFSALASTGTQLKTAQAASASADATINTATTNLTQQQSRLDQATSQIAQNTNLAGLGQSLAAIGGGFNSAYQTDVDQANKAKTALAQQAGLGTIANAGAALSANAFGVANINQTNAQALDVQHAGLVDQQAQQVGSALQAALTKASAQSGLQLQTMQQDLSTAIASLQNDLQYATGEQQIAIQNYINALVNEQARLKNAIGGGAVTDQEITQIGSSVATGVASAAAAYTSSAKNSGTSA